MLSDFKEMLSTLRAEKVEFLVIGAHALAVHGIVRASLDFDIWVRPTMDNAQRLWRALQQFGAPLHQATIQDFAKPGVIFQIGATPNCIHILTSITGVEFDAAWPNRVESSIPELQDMAPVIGRHELIVNKQATGRPKDLLDVGALTQQPCPNP